MKQIITARRVLRGEQLEPLDNGAIVIDEGTIVKVLPVRELTNADRAGAQMAFGGNGPPGHDRVSRPPEH